MTAFTSEPIIGSSNINPMLQTLAEVVDYLKEIED